MTAKGTPTPFSVSFRGEVPQGVSAAISDDDHSRIFEIGVDQNGIQAQPISMNVELAARQLEALGSPVRLQVYRALVRAGHAGLPVGQLQQRVDIPASTLSHHLHRLIQTGLVTQERQATTLLCRAVYPAMRTLVGFLVDECCTEERCAGTENAA